MQETGAQSINELINKTNSEIILFFIIIAILFLILAIPLSRILMDNKRKGKEQDIKAQKLLIDVIKGNSDVMSQLKTVLESTNSNCAKCKAEQLMCFKRIEDKQNANMIILTKIENRLEPKL